MVEKSTKTQDRDKNISESNIGQRIVIDMGKDTIKAGFAGEDGPREILRNNVGSWEDVESILSRTF